MKIGIDVRLWDESGVGRYIRNLVKNLELIDKENRYVLFALPKNYNSVKKAVRNRKWRVVNADFRWHTIDEQIKFPKILEKEKLDIVHFPYFSVPIFYDLPYVLTIHDLIIDHFPTGKASTLNPFLYKAKLIGYKYVIAKAAENAKKIITVSKATKKEIIDHLKIEPKNVTVIYEAVDDKIASKNLRGKKKKYFLYVGNAYPHKNLDRLINAFANFNKKDISLVLVGKEDYFYKGLKEKVKNMEIRNRVLFYENVSDEELSKLYKNAIALIMPSLMEGFGLPILEAMANKCLVLASGIPAFRELCGKNAIFFDPENLDSISQKLKYVSVNRSSSKIKNMTKNGLKHVENFSWQRAAEETLEIYESSVSLRQN